MLGMEGRVAAPRTRRPRAGGGRGGWPSAACRRPRPGSARGRTGNLALRAHQHLLDQRRAVVVRAVDQVAQAVEREALAEHGGREQRLLVGRARAGPSGPGPGSAPSPARRLRRAPRHGAGAGRGTRDCRPPAPGSGGRTRGWPRDRRRPAPPPPSGGAARGRSSAAGCRRAPRARPGRAGRPRPARS